MSSIFVGNFGNNMKNNTNNVREFNQINYGGRVVNNPGNIRGFTINNYNGKLASKANVRYFNNINILK